MVDVEFAREPPLRAPYNFPSLPVVASSASLLLCRDYWGLKFRLRRRIMRMAERDNKRAIREEWPFCDRNVAVGAYLLSSVKVFS